MRINGFPEENTPIPQECECNLINCFHLDIGCLSDAAYELTFTRKSGEMRRLFVCRACFEEYEKAQCPETGITMFARHIGDWNARKV